MPARLIKGYHVRHSIGQQSLIVLTYDGGEAVSLPAVSATEAHHLVDLLRNEKPIWYDAAKRELITSVEPVGEGE
jgi:hypothetical protein